MIVCVCSNISDKAIKKCTSLEEAQDKLGACLCCQKCKEEIQKNCCKFAKSVL